MLFNHFLWVPYTELNHFEQNSVAGNSGDSPAYFYRWVLCVFGHFDNIQLDIGILEMSPQSKEGNLLHMLNDATTRKIHFRFVWQWWKMFCFNDEKYEKDTLTSMFYREYDFQTQYPYELCHNPTIWQISVANPLAIAQRWLIIVHH